MSFEKEAGDFRFAVSGPYPCWITIQHRGDDSPCIQMHHKDLADLKHLIEWAMREARQRLGDDRDEVPSP